MFDRFVLDAVRVAVILGLALGATAALRRRPPALRRIVLAVALGGALVMPAASALLPGWGVPAPVATTGERLRARVLGDGPIERHLALEAEAGGLAAVGRGSVGLAPRSVDWRAIAGAVWALGALAFATRILVGLARSRALVRGASPATGWTAAIARAERATGIRADVRMTDRARVPAVTGVGSPVILVPRASTAWDDERRHAVLLHELAHVQARDCLVQLIAEAACALHWFNPLAWLAARRLRLERELAADASVVASGARPSRYADDLVAIAQSAWSGDAPSTVLGMGERSHLAARVTAIIAPGPARRLSRVHAASATLACAALTSALACTRATPVSTTTPRAASLPGSAVQSAHPGSNTTLNPTLQAIAEGELDRAIADSGAEAGAIVVLEPQTGYIVASAGKAHGLPADVATQTAYVTGSTLKAVTLAAALDEGVVTPTDRFDCERGGFTYAGQTMRDAGSYGTLTLTEALAVSSNVAFTKVFDRLGGAPLGRALRAFRFGVAPAIEGATAGYVPARIEDHSFDGAVTAIGEVVTASPVQLAAAFATLANDGEYVAPTRTVRATAPRERVIKAETARTVVAMLEEVVRGARATGQLARVDGVRVAGKTGTAEWDLPSGGVGRYASFAGIVPTTDATAGRTPRFVIVVGLEQPSGGAAGGTVAAPVFARVATRALAAR